MSDNVKIEVGDRVRIMAVDLREGAIMPMGALLGSHGTVKEMKSHNEAVVETDMCTSVGANRFIHPIKNLKLVCKKNHQYFTGKVICTKSSSEDPSYCDFTVGKVYSIQNGVLYDDIEDIPYTNKIEDVNYLNMKNDGDYPGEFEFIEFKGFANK